MKPSLVKTRKNPLLQNKNPHEPLMVVHSNVDFFIGNKEVGVFAQTIALSKQRFCKPLFLILYVFSGHPSMDMRKECNMVIEMNH